MRHASIKSYQDALEYLHGKQERPYAHNTRIEMAADHITVKYHGNPVVNFMSDGTNEYNSCGWMTPTTKERINWFLPDGFSLWQEKSVWYISDRSNGWENARRFVFADGIQIKDGQVSGDGPENEQEQVKKQIKRIKKFVDGYIKALLAMEVPAPSAGDCWQCGMTTQDGESLGDVTHSDHIESHMEESYYVPSLLTRAYEHNQRMCAITRDGIARLFQKEAIGEWQASIVEREVRSSMTAYLKKQLGIAVR